MSEFIYQDGELKEKLSNENYFKIHTEFMNNNFQYVSYEKMQNSFNKLLETSEYTKIKLKELDININSIKITNEPYKYMNPIKEEVKPVFNIGDKVQVIKDNYKLVSNENINLKGFTGLITNIICNCWENTTIFIYHVDINGLEFSFWQSELKLIEKSKTIEYRKDLYDLADDIDGCLLSDSKKSIELIQGL